MVILIIGLALFFLSAIIVLVTENLNMIGWLLRTMLLGFFLALIGVVSCVVTSCQPKPIEYSASYYDLKLKVTEYDGKRDTAYVFIFHEGQRSFITEHLASKYELKLRTTEYEGQKDTTYVLVKKPHSASTNCK